MQTIKAFIIAIALLWAQPARAQLAVIDIFAELQWPVQLEYMLEQWNTLVDQYEDMLVQAGIDRVPWNEDTEGVLDDITDYLHSGGGDGIFYTDDIDGEWEDLFKGIHAGQDSDVAWVHGWQDRGWGLARTQRKLLNLVKMQHESFAGDNERIQQLQHAVDIAEGRNQLIKAQNALAAEQIRQQQMQKQLDMTIANAQIMYNAYEVNEKFTREAWQRKFMTNFDEEPEIPQFVDRGL